MAEHLPPTSDNDRDALEAELESFRPVPLSAEVSERVGRELRHDWRQGRRLGISLAAGLAAAACAVVAFYGWGRRDAVVPDGGQVALTRPTHERPIASAGSQLPLPSIAAYRHALAKSPDALDALLDAHAPRLLPGTGAAVGRDAFHSSRVLLSTSNGDTL